jgi:hypothetical protein
VSAQTCGWILSDAAPWAAFSTIRIAETTTAQLHRRRFWRHATVIELTIVPPKMTQNLEKTTPSRCGGLGGGFSLRTRHGRPRVSATNDV